MRRRLRERLQERLRFWAAVFFVLAWGTLVFALHALDIIE